MEQIFPYLIWGGLFFLMMRFGCGSHMFGHGHGKKGHEGAHQSHGHGCCGPASGRSISEPKPENSTETHVDPVCGTRVSTEKSKTSFHAGTVYHFCSRECREVFEAAPDSYLPGAKTPPATPASNLLLHSPQSQGRDHAS